MNHHTESTINIPQDTHSCTKNRLGPIIIRPEQANVLLPGHIYHNCLGASSPGGRSISLYCIVYQASSLRGSGIS